MKPRRMVLAATLAALAALGTTACSDAEHETCVGFCEDCPDGQLIKEDTNCEDFCDAWEELSELAGCEDLWEDNWGCLEDREGCDTGSCFEGGSYGDCVERYCGDSEAHQAECDDISREHGSK